MVTTSLTFDKASKQQGFLQVPYSHNLGGWANVLIPITSISNRAGPTALVLAGNHGDEYQGQIAIMKLARELTPGMVRGRIILIPSLNFPAARAATRLSPVDGLNMNRKPPTILTQALGREDYLLAPESGIFEICLDLGTKVKRGQTVGCIYHLERPDRTPEPLVAKSAGYLIAMRAPCLTQQGDCVAVIAQEVSKKEVMKA